MPLTINPKQNQTVEVDGVRFLCKPMTVSIAARLADHVIAADLNTDGESVDIRSASPRINQTYAETAALCVVGWESGDVIDPAGAPIECDLRAGRADLELFPPSMIFRLGERIWKLNKLSEPEVKN